MFNLFLNPLISAFLEVLLGYFPNCLCLFYSALFLAPEKLFNLLFHFCKNIKYMTFILCLIIPIFAGQTLLPVISMTLSHDTLLPCVPLIFDYEFMFLKALCVRIWGWNKVGFLQTLVCAGFIKVQSSCEGSWELDCWFCLFILNNFLRYGLHTIKFSYLSSTLFLFKLLKDC